MRCLLTCREVLGRLRMYRALVAVAYLVQVILVRVQAHPDLFHQIIQAKQAFHAKRVRRTKPDR